MVDPVEGIEFVSKFVQVPKGDPHAVAAGKKFAKAADTIATAVNNALLIVEAVNFGVARTKEYFAKQFANDVIGKLKDVPPENIIEPKLSTVGPALQGLAYAHDEESLKDLYLELIASAMNSDNASTVHPSFVEIIKQLSGEEAIYLKAFLSASRTFQVVSVGISAVPGGYEIFVDHILNVHGPDGPIQHVHLSAWVDNWIRLGIFAQDKERKYSEDVIWVKEHDQYKDLVARATRENQSIVRHGSTLSQTAFGTLFARAIGIPDPVVSVA